jgi:hypothetical protein
MGNQFGNLKDWKIFYKCTFLEFFVQKKVEGEPDFTTHLADRNGLRFHFLLKPQSLPEYFFPVHLVLHRWTELLSKQIYEMERTPTTIREQSQ